MDKIILTELKIETVIGIWEWEKRNPQTILIDLEMQTDIKKASETDSIEDALDYKAITKLIANNKASTIVIILYDTRILFSRT